MNPRSLHEIGAASVEEYRDACESLVLAQMDYDFEMLAARLRKCLCCQEELNFAADYLEGKIPKRKRGRHRSIKDLRRDIEINEFVSTLVRRGIKKEAAISEAEIKFNLPRSSIYAALPDKNGRYRPLQDQLRLQRSG